MTGAVTSDILDGFGIPMIDIQNLTKRYDGKVAISDVTFTVEDGEVLGLLGPNGAGKTTTMRAITGYLPVTEGRVLVDGYDVFEKPIEARRRIGYLPEQPPLYLEMTVSGYLRFAARIKGVPRSDVNHEVERVIDTVHIREVADRIIARLSKGYRQRVGLAQALLNDPPVLVLDEPTVGLDPKQILEVRDLIREWRGRHTVILSTHILPEVEQTCSRVVIIDHGRIIAVDTPTNLVRQLEGGDRVTLEIGGPLDEVVARFSSLPGVRNSMGAPTAAGRCRVDVESLEGNDIRPLLASTVVGAGWSLFQMQSATMSLEDVFLKLTTDDADDAGESPDEAIGDHEPGEAS
jgi:ABC-2 type transport system ATP-binding protein